MLISKRHYRAKHTDENVCLSVKGMVSVFAEVGSRLVADVVRLVSVLRQIAVNACLVFSAGLITSAAAFIVLRRLEPPNHITVATAAMAATRENSPAPRPVQRNEDSVANIITPSSIAGAATDAVISDRNSIDIKMAHRMPFSETHV